MRARKKPLMEITKLHQTPINKSRENGFVNQLVEQYYATLSADLVRTEEDLGIFQDVVLSMTYKFTEGDFCEAFRKEFRSHKSRLQRIRAANRYRFYPVDEHLLADPSGKKE
ncbi:MAG: hypothetical protein LIP04_16605 [Tannerellaceae bacterium]|nr:hypothetical protein [Tannerellaceae bacterium]